MMKHATIYQASLIPKEDGYLYPSITLSDDAGKLHYFNSHRHDYEYWMLQIFDVFDIQRLDELPQRQVLWDPSIDYITSIENPERRWAALQIENID